MAIGHDILIKVDEKFKSHIYRVLVSYIGMHNTKQYPKESALKNGLRIVHGNYSMDVSIGQIKRWAQTRLYFFHHTIVMEKDKSEAIFNALLKSLYEIPGKKDDIDAILENHFNMIKKPSEEFSRRLSILEYIYRNLIVDSSNNIYSSNLCNSLLNIEESYN